ncbi:MAG: imidazole glycerol phosphate synthase subunit HisH, partial [Flavobacteriia bacterium]|nr:imidazole glycerol phosphate synthase subunit HisH [Flavobacteriia bacterium]
MEVVIIDYGAGNLFSVQQAFKRLGIEPIISTDRELISNATHVVFPGVGHAQTAMQQLKSKQLDVLIPTLKQPVLGICLGMQLLCEFTEEGN